MLRKSHRLVYFHRPSNKPNGKNVASLIATRTGNKSADSEAYGSGTLPSKRSRNAAWFAPRYCSGLQAIMRLAIVKLPTALPRVGRSDSERRLGRADIEYRFRRQASLGPTRDVY